MACACAAALRLAADVAPDAEVCALVEATVPGLLCEASAEALLVAPTRVAARLAAITARVTVALAEQAAAPVLAGTGLSIDPLARVHGAGTESVATAVRVSPVSAARRVGDALALLTGGYEVLLDALHAGTTTVGHPHAVPDALDGLPCPLVRAVLGRAEVHASLAADPPGVTARLVARLAAELGPDRQAEAEERASDSRDAQVWTGGGRRALHAETTGADAEVATAALAAAVRRAQAAGDPRSPAQIRHDLVLDPLWARIWSLCHPPRPTSSPSAIRVTSAPEVARTSRGPRPGTRRLTCGPAATCLLPVRSSGSSTSPHSASGRTTRTALPHVARPEWRRDGDPHHDVISGSYDPGDSR